MEVEIPMLDMDESEKNGTVDPVVVQPKSNPLTTRRKTRLRKGLIISGTVVIVLVILIGVMSLSVFFLAKVIKYPDIYIIGNITGNVSANLGTLGHVHLTPELQLSIKVNV